MTRGMGAWEGKDDYYKMEETVKSRETEVSSGIV